MELLEVQMEPLRQFTISLPVLLVFFAHLLRVSSFKIMEKNSVAAIVSQCETI